MQEPAALYPLAQLYKALSHPARLCILRALMHQEACVCHLTALLRRPQPYISQQLSILKDAGLVSDRREGQVIYYRVADAPLTELLELGQQALAARGQSIVWPCLPTSPLPNCHCPRCTGETPS